MDKFLGFKTEEILTCLLLVIVGYAIAKMFNRSCANRLDSFSVGVPRQCRNTRIGLDTTCRAGQQWQEGTRDFACPTMNIPEKNISADFCPDFCNFDGGDSLCPTDANNPLCTGVESLNIPGIYNDGNKWVNQCISC